MFNLVNLIIIVMVVAIALFILKAVRQTKEDIDERLKGVDPAKRNEFAKALAEKIRAQDVRCPRCGKQAFGLMGTVDRWKCHTCNFEFDGPPHIPEVDD